MSHKDVNLYTTGLFTVGLYAFFGYLLHLNTDNFLLFFVITLLIVTLDFFPIILPSGLTYSSGFIGYLYFAFHFGLGSSVFPLLLGTLATFLKFSRGSIYKINWFRFFSTIGMLFLSVVAALLVKKLTAGLPLLVSVFLIILAFEMCNALMHAGIRRTMVDDSVWHLFVERLRELTIPIIVSTIVLGRLLAIEENTLLITEVFYTTCFMLLIIFFSTAFLKQIRLREKRIAESNQRFSFLMEKSNDLIFALDDRGRITLSNPPASQLMRMVLDPMNDNHFVALFKGEEHFRCKKYVYETLQGIPHNFEIRMRQPDGAELYLNIIMTPNFEEDRTFAVICTIKDVTAQKRAELLLQHMAYYDSLTDLPNRRLFYETLQTAMEQAQAEQQALAVMMFDLDSFKIINDTLGHDTGDALLQLVAQRLSANVSGDALVARMGGDEFMVMLPHVTSKEQVSVFAEQLIHDFEKPIVLKALELRITTSIGISLYPDDGQTIEALVKHADTAMYRSKATGKNNFKFFTAAMNAELSKRHEIEQDLRNALARQEFMLYYQPQINTHSGAVEGVEALVRWNHPQKGLIPPLQFIPVAEETGFIIELGDWVLKTACAQAVQWQALGLPPFTMSVNLSLRQFEDPDLIAKITRHLEATGLEPHWLKVELTESLFTHDLSDTVHTLQELKDRGVQVAIDDFGTGYSSLSYLSKLPVDTLKLDKSFVQNIHEGSKEAEIATSIINLAHKIGLHVVAEGVDSTEKLAFLQERECDAIQGYYYSPPLPPLKLEAFIQEHRELQDKMLKKRA